MKMCAPILVGLMLHAAAGLAAPSEVGKIEINGAIGPATASYISRAIKVASARDYRCLIIQLNTPGGLLQSTKEIVQAFYASSVPTVVYVAPSGAIAASAGTFITMAADIAAMAPNTSIGAAHPVELGVGGSEKLDDTMKQKLENFGSSYIEAIAEKRGRNAQWAMSAVRKSASITSEQALATNVIDVIAQDVPELLQKIDGREVNGKRLNTAGATVVVIPMSWGERLFQHLWGPEVMMLLLLVTIYGIIGEISHPGAILPGVAGAIALVLFLYMTTMIPVNAAGIALLVVALVLFVTDIYSPTHGILTTGGIVAFFLGLLLLFNHAAPGFRLSLGYIVFATAATALFFVFVVAAGLRAQRLPVRAGRETMLGKVVPAMQRIDANSGKVFIEGEYWNAVSDQTVEQNQPVEVVGIEGLTLIVKPKT